MQTNQTAVITINIGSAMQKMADLTIPTMKAYAERINADFIVINKIPKAYQFMEYSAYWAKFILQDYLAQYERIIYLDLDVTVTPDCPNLFEIVPHHAFAALIEDDYGINHSDEIELIQKKYGDIGWTKGYFNVGVMVFAREHIGAFTLHENLQSDAKYPEQTVMNYNVKKAGYAFFKLSHKFNHMYFLNVMHDQRHESYISHYAGIAQRLREAMIVEDIRRLSIGLTLLDDRNIEQFVQESFTAEEIQQITYHTLLKDAEVFEKEAEHA